MRALQTVSSANRPEPVAAFMICLSCSFLTEMFMNHKVASVISKTLCFSSLHTFKDCPALLRLKDAQEEYDGEEDYRDMAIDTGHIGSNKSQYFLSSLMCPPF